MIGKFDAIVVGAGPAGSTAALILARAGLKVILLERGEYPGSKNVSGAALYGTRILHELTPNFWEEAPVERYLTRRVLTFISPQSSFSLDFRTTNFDQPPYNGFTVLRPKFDRWFASKAQEAGALLVPATVADDLIWDGDMVVGVRTRREDGEIYGDVVIAADGVNSLLAKKAGLRRDLDAHQVSIGVKEVIALDRQTIEERFNLQGDAGVTYEFAGSVTGQVYGGGFLYTNRDSLSIGIVAKLASLVEKQVKIYELLEEFKSHPSIEPLVRDGVVKEYSAHMVPEAGWRMIPKLYSNGLLVVGDAAAFNLHTGIFSEGMNYAIASAAAAAETVKQAKAKGDFSSRSLSRYRRLLQRSFVLQDLKRFKRAPDFVNNPRLQNVYPITICRAAENLFKVEGSPRRKVAKVVLGQLREDNLSLWQVLRDAIDGGRALIW